MTSIKTFAAGLFLALLVGCGIMPLKPGVATFTRPDGSTLTVKQPQNPKDSTIQKYSRTEEQGKVTESIETKIGAAQKDVAREMAAKLGSLRPVMWVGVLLFVFGLASFHPYLRAIIGSVTTSLVILAAGLLLMVLPTLIVGNELLILGGTLGVTAVYIFAIRHGKLQGFVDANKDGIDDRKQK